VTDLQALVERVVREMAPWGQGTGPIVVRPGGLPEDFPDDLRLPGRLIGSIEQGLLSAVFLVTNQPPAEALASSGRELEVAGWYRHEEPDTSESDRRWVRFCRGPNGPSLVFEAQRRPSGGSTLRLRLERDPEHSPCAHPPGFRLPSRPHPIGALDIAAPPNGRFRMQGSGWAPGSFTAYTGFDSNLPAAEISAYYEQSLRHQGWDLTQSGESGPVAWSDWTAHDDGRPVNGFLLVMEPSPGSFAVDIDRERSPGSRDRDMRERIEEMRARQEDGAAMRPVVIEPPLDGAAAVIEAACQWTANGLTPWLLTGHPPDLDLPLPPGRVMGSLVAGRRTIVYLESDLDPLALLERYESQLAPRWILADVDRTPGGIVPSATRRSAGAEFHSTEGGPALRLTASATHGAAEVRLQVQVNNGRTPHDDSAARRTVGNEQPELPALTPPADSDVVFGRGWGGPDRWESTGYLIGPSSLLEVADHYVKQLEAAGWVQREAGRDAVVAWSRWDGRDRHGLLAGFLVVVQSPGTTRMVVRLVGVRRGRDRGGREIGWRSGARPHPPSPAPPPP